MKTNELKKGTRVFLRNGWEAILEDNLKGNIRYAKVFGDVTEVGAIYTHDIISFRVDDECDNECDVWETVDYTPEQLKLRETVDRIFG